MNCLGALGLAVAGLSAPGPATAQVTAFKQAVAEAAARDTDIAAFYQSNGYAPLWTGQGDDSRRRAALLRALAQAGDHGLPAARYDLAGLRARMEAARSPRDLGRLDVEMSRVFLQFARDLQTGVLVPSRVDSAIVREVPYRDRASYLTNFAKSSPNGFFRALPPATNEYNTLMKQKLDMERLLARGGWGPTIASKMLEPGQSGPAVIALRNRLVAMGYLERTAVQTYDTAMQDAVRQFQTAHGLAADGVAGPATMAEVNVGVQARLQSVIVAMERERWLNTERGRRHILVNLTDFTAKIIDNDKVTFETRSVVGATQSDRVTPEFSDVMEFMVVNPSWYVPRSIATKEYLPALKRNPNAVSHIEITDSRGRKVNRGAVDFTQFTERSFPFSMRQPPSRGNALGLVKFMFPNKYNIYLHDTPAKNLFSREVRAFSHGCVRLADPFDFAYALLAKQTANPQGLFKAKLATGVEQRINLKEPVPVHIIYRTAFTDARGAAQYRRDIYGRDARIWNALAKAGVALRAVQG
ncbi:murein L,D-transpeptidase [Sulfitobacter sabulilitoris]|uniref:Murein L,D-transpeptidase n=2 Tax=Sulfitobacter sabulilitoris TaxID=2562655 RepID=A0A5S3PMI8_9RHOB|nr:L,D-transpeptidase family protein [Sulfitobacter sabulilitoris]TMM55597.1 murein L,D-transpeptidase [Sulfitobacter sabulilitoris]